MNESERINPVIIVVAYSRPASLKRLLKSLNEAEYPTKNQKLILSLDGGAAKEVEEISDRYAFKWGDVEVIKREKNLGLRKHVLWAGYQVNKYGSVIVLEDDLIVDKWFYYFASKMLQYSCEKGDVAGISLYSQKYNEYSGFPFEPLKNEYGFFYMKIPSSWGQVWSYSQWMGFMEWLAEIKPYTISDCEGLPSYVKKWPETSWKKYYSAYCVMCDKYFIYPYESYTTNFADSGGTHTVNGTDILQVSFRDSLRGFEGVRVPINDSDIFNYDQFMEPDYNAIYNKLGMGREEINIDIYGIKSIELLKNKKYVLTTKKCSKYIKRFPLVMKPVDLNVLREELVAEKYCCDYIYLAESIYISSNKSSCCVLFDYYSNMDFYSKKNVLRAIYLLMKGIKGKCGR